MEWLPAVNHDPVFSLIDQLAGPTLLVIPVDCTNTSQHVRLCRAKHMATFQLIPISLHYATAACVLACTEHVGTILCSMHQLPTPMYCCSRRDLSDNQFNGGLPASWSALTSIQTMYAPASTVSLITLVPAQPPLLTPRGACLYWGTSVDP
jgi:hypothetical protein